ncbi:MAG: cytochrome c peroxidase [Polyangiales bacterium]
MRRLLLLGLATLTSCSKRAPTAGELGKQVFFDQTLSQPEGQACADCHAPHVAFRDPESDQTTSSGILDNHFGPRNSPSIMYARWVPDLHQDTKGDWFGGMFWDGRAASFEAQAGFPLLNPSEMNNPDKATVVASVRKADYAEGFRKLYGKDALDDVDKAFEHISNAIAEFERTPELAPFSSKYDRYLRKEIELAPAELRGLAIFEDPNKGNCAGCHPSRPGADGAPPMFTNFGYANLGIPKYGNSRFYEQGKTINPEGEAFIDHGLSITVKDPKQDGKFRTPTLRNIGRTAPYGHNGYFENLLYLLDFLNTRDTGSKDPHVKPWAAPEVAANVEQRVGHLGLTEHEVNDLDEFLQTLSDQLEKGPAPVRNPRTIKPKP